jgi:uncharacterized protein YbbC (DUF1343 family)
MDLTRETDMTMCGKHRRQAAAGKAAGLMLAALALGCAPPEPAERASSAAPPQPSAPAPVAEAERPVAEVRSGLEVLLADSLHLVRGQRVGLLTNHSAVTRSGESVIDALHQHPEVDLVALFGPEHGLRGGIEGGVRIEDEVDEATGLPVFSLYGARQRPTPESLAGLDALIFDMQDIGARPYTFVWTMAMAMEVAAAEGLPFLVLDRPNPITGRMEGPLMQMEMRDVAQPITGYYPVPLRHGMTVGEIARYVNEEYGVGARLTVVPADGWSDDVWFDETRLPWIDPSPNIRSLDAALRYAGLVLLEATNLTVGRGTDDPFAYVGAPWVDSNALLERLAAHDLPGVRFHPARFVPEGEGWVPFRGETVHGVRIEVTDRERYPSVLAALVLMHEIRNQDPQRFRVTNEGMTQMLGSRWARRAFDRGDDPHAIVARWEEELAAWSRVRERYRMYPAD